MLTLTRHYGKYFRYFLLGIVLMYGYPVHASAAAIESSSGATVTSFPRPVDSYADQDAPGLGDKLIQRIKSEPFNLVATLIFLCAVIHTFLASRFMAIAHRFQHKFGALENEEHDKSPAHAGAIALD